MSAPVRERVGIAGLGRMGAAVGQRLAAEGYSISGWTRSGRRVEGIAPAATLADLVAGSDTLILSLYDDAAVAEVLDALAGMDLGGRLIADTSTVAPDLLRGRAEALEARGALAVDAPISGGPELVLAGRCGIFLGGTEAAAARARAVLEDVTPRLFHVGPPGAGLAMKVVNNAMLQAYFAGLAEMLPLAREAGIPFETALRIVAGGPAGMPMLADRLPRALGEDDSVGFSLADVLKDNAVFRAALAAHDLPSPLLDRFADLAGDAPHIADKDVAAFIPHAYTRR